MEKISNAAARRAAIAAQGFCAPKPAAAPTARHLTRVLSHTNLLQMDSIAVLARAHYVPLFSRLGPYDMALLEHAAWGRKRSLFEFWAHEASLLPMALHPLIRWRMHDAAAGRGTWKFLAKFAREEHRYIDAVLARISTEGAAAASALEGPKRAPGWWEWSHAKHALEYLFWTGQVTTASRRNFERIYDLTERVIPPPILSTPTPSRADAQRELLRLSARALAVATAGDLRDYFRLSPADVAPRIAELVEAGELRPVQVEGWKNTAYIPAQTIVPRRVTTAALLCPFDPLIWDRARTERLFGFHYRLEIYTPAHKRVHGYYVLPFLLNDCLVARLDLKTVRAENMLRVVTAHAEPGAPAATAQHLAAELRSMANWLGLSHISVAGRGDFVKQLKQQAVLF